MSTDKACLFNLIVYTEDEKQLGYLNNIADQVVAKFPARIIVIYGNLNAPDKGVEIQKTPFENSSFPLFDKISLQLCKKNLESVSLFVLPYLIPDYPTYLFFSGNPVKESTVFNALIRLSDRLIVDADTSDNLNDFCTTILKELSKNHQEIIDISWARIGGWKLTLSNLFDTQEKLQNLCDCKLVQIVYQNATNSLNQALYLQAWLASCLKWTFKAHQTFDSTIELSYFHDETPILVHLTSVDSDKHQGEAITTVQITAKDGQLFDIKLLKDEPQVCIHISSYETCDLPYTLYFPNFDRGSAYLTQLLYSSTSPQYAAMIPTLKKFYE